MKPKRLYIFDFDKTLVDSEARVLLVNESGSSIRISKDEYLVHKLRPGEHYSYEEFESYDVIENAEPTPLLSEVRNILNLPDVEYNEQVIVLTSRAVKSVVDEYLRKHDVNVHGIITINDPNWVGMYPSLNNAERKRVAIEELIEQLYLNSQDRIIYYDDDEEILEEISKIKSNCPITLEHYTIEKF